MLKWLKNFVEQSWLLIAASFVFGLLLALANLAWTPRIEQNKIDKLNKLMGSLISGAEKFEPMPDGVTVNLGRGKTAQCIVYKALGGDGTAKGFCFIAEGTGFADKIELVVAVDASFEKIFGFNVLSSSETPGFGDQIAYPFYNDQFKGAPADKLELVGAGDAKQIDNKIVAISGATVSSSAVVNIFNNYLGRIKQALVEKGVIQ